MANLIAADKFRNAIQPRRGRWNTKPFPAQLDVKATHITAGHSKNTAGFNYPWIVSRGRHQAFMQQLAQAGPPVWKFCASSSDWGGSRKNLSLFNNLARTRPGKTPPQLAENVIRIFAVTGLLGSLFPDLKFFALRRGRSRLFRPNRSLPEHEPRACDSRSASVL